MARTNNFISLLYGTIVLAVAILAYTDLFSISGAYNFQATAISVLLVFLLLFYVRYHYFLIRYFMRNNKFYIGEKILYPIVIVVSPSVFTVGVEVIVLQPEDSIWIWGLAILFFDLGDFLKRPIDKFLVDSGVSKAVHAETSRGVARGFLFITFPPTSRVDFILGDVWLFVLATIGSFFVLVLS